MGRGHAVPVKNPKKNDIYHVKNSNEFYKFDGRQWELYCEHGKRKCCCATCRARKPGGPKKGEIKKIPGSEEYMKFNGSNWKRHCAHGIQKAHCNACGGSATCEHGRQRLQCTECPHTKRIPAAICKMCCERCLSLRRRVGGVCAVCDPSVPERTEKVFGRMIVDAVGFEPNAKDFALASTSGGCGDLARRRPDLLWVAHGKIAVVVEIDEDSHSDRNADCELAKISTQNETIQRLDGCHCIPVVTIRVNPDGYDGRTVTRQQRADEVARIVNMHLHGPSPERNGDMPVYFLYYHSKSQHLVEAHKACVNYTVQEIK